MNIFLIIVAICVIIGLVVKPLNVVELQEFYSATSKGMEESMIVDPKIPPETEIETDEYPWETDVEGDDSDGADEEEED